MADLATETSGHPGGPGHADAHQPASGGHNAAAIDCVDKTSSHSSESVVEAGDQATGMHTATPAAPDNAASASNAAPADGSPVSHVADTGSIAVKDGPDATADADAVDGTSSPAAADTPRVAIEVSLPLPHNKRITLFELHPPVRKRWILAAAAIISVLTPATDTIYLPALGAVGKHYSASEDDVHATVSAYMAAVGAFALVWGPLSDRYGRRPPLLVSLVLFLAVTLPCAWAPSIGGLIALRTVQGAVVGSTISITMGVVADAFSPSERGMAMGIFMIPLLVGPIAAPVIGGALSAAFGWQSLFYLLAVLGVLLFLLALTLPETHHHIVLTARRAAAATAPEQVEDEEHVVKPTLQAPWKPLAYLVEGQILPYVVLSAALFASMFVSLTQLPLLLAAPPYSLGESATGLTYLAIGGTMMVASVVGGAVSDHANNRAVSSARAAADAGGTPVVYPAPAVRLVPNAIGALMLPAGCLIFGLVFQHGAPIGAALFGHALIGGGQALYNPGFAAYLSSVKQRAAAGASAANMAVMFVMSAVLISCAVPLQRALGVGGLFGLLAGLSLLAIVWAAADLRFRVRKAGDSASANATAAGAH